MLLGSLVWIASVAIVVVSGWLRSWGDFGFLAFSCFAAFPVTLGPVLLVSRTGRASRGFHAYLLKLNLYVGVLVFFGTYFGTHYFFDLMGMRYAFPTRLVFDAELLGRSGSHVPVFMYPLTQAYFMTYFTVLVVVERGIRRRFNITRTNPLAAALLVGALSYGVAFAETFFMATDLMADLFAYEKKGRMLLFGSFGYAVYFVVGLPMVRDLDEPEQTWTIRHTGLRALAACMLILVLLEVWAKAVGRL